MGNVWMVGRELMLFEGWTLNAHSIWAIVETAYHRERGIVEEVLEGKISWPSCLRCCCRRRQLQRGTAAGERFGHDDAMFETNVKTADSSP